MRNTELVAGPPPAVRVQRSDPDADIIASMTGESNVAYDALLLVSFGGPEGHEDVMPFLRNVTRGRAVSEQRLAEVAEHYHRFDGVSPINAQCRALLAAIRAEFATHALDLPVYWGNRNWPPTLDQAMATMAEDGIRRALVLTTAAYPSYPGCRQYREDLARARCEVGDRAPRLDKLRHYFNHPGFLDPMTEHTLAALDTLPVPVRDDAELVFSTHSIPTATARTAGQDGGAYVAAHVDVARTVAAGVRAATGRDRRWALAYQSRSGPPDQSWLEPDINEHLRTLGATGVPAAVVVPIGFVSDHMEVRYDLDVEARATAEQAGIGFARAATVGTAAAFVAAIRELVVERMATAAARDGRVHRAAVGALGPSHDVCPPGCCPNPRGALPAAAGGE